MRAVSSQPEFPLRPMTLGELLDAAMALLRRRAVPLLCAAVVLAAAEQFALGPLRTAQHVSAPYFGPDRGHFGGWWTLVAFGFAFEAAIITLLAGYASAAAESALLGRGVSDRALWRRVRPFATGTVAVLVGAVCGVAAFLGFLPWLFAFGLLGLAAPALVIDRAANPFTALGRSAALAARSGLRGCWVLLAGYLTWFAVRFALGAGWTAVVSALTGSWPQWMTWLSPAAWALANTVAYAALACVCAVLLLETRIRTEGLDLSIARARSRGEDDAAPLVRAR
jgi:hypothetical protein